MADPVPVYLGDENDPKRRLIGDAVQLEDGRIGIFVNEASRDIFPNAVPVSVSIREGRIVAKE